VLLLFPGGTGIPEDAGITNSHGLQPVAFFVCAAGRMW